MIFHFSLLYDTTIDQFDEVIYGWNILRACEILNCRSQWFFLTAAQKDKDSSKSGDDIVGEVKYFEGKQSYYRQVCVMPRGGAYMEDRWYSDYS